MILKVFIWIKKENYINKFSIFITIIALDIMIKTNILYIQHHL